MKKIVVLLLTISILLSFSSCTKKFEKADELSANYLEALLLRDEAKMKEYIHPDHGETAIPNDDFYANLEKQKLPVGTELTALEAGPKNYVEDTELEGTVLQCNYIIRANELFYDVELIILDNDEGYGVVAVSVESNLEYLHSVLSGS